MSIMKRRHPRPLAGQIRQAVWPSMGWRRTVSYYWHRLFRTGDSAYKITAGLASGVAVSFTPFLGTHIGQALLLSWLVRGSLVAGVVGTAAGNPWTLPFMLYLVYRTGVAVCGVFGLQDFVALPPTGGLDEVGDSLDFLGRLFAHPMKLLLPAAIGGYLWAFLTWFLSYALMYYPVRTMGRAYHEARALSRRLRRGKRMGSEAGGAASGNEEDAP